MDRNRARGLLVGLAIGDALGAPVEFEAPAAIAGKREWLFSLPGGGPFQWAPGEFTDDTQMAIVLAHRLIEDHDGLVQQQLALDFSAWAAHPGTRDVGHQTSAVLSQVSRGSAWQAAIASLSPDAAGNGSLMRVAPVALIGQGCENVMTLARAQSQVTHPHRWCQDACAVFAAGLLDVLTGHGLRLGELANLAEQPEVARAVQAASAAEPPQMSGFVLHTLTGALWAVSQANGFSDAVWRAVALGRDADTVGAVAGALAGAIWGIKGIPTALTTLVTTSHPLFTASYPDELIRLADALCTLG